MGGQGKSAWWTGAVRASLVTDQQGWKNENANIISVSGQIRSPAMRSRHMHGRRDDECTLLYTKGCAHAHTQRGGGRNATSISQALDVFTAASVKNCHVSHFSHSWADWDGGHQEN